MAETDKVNNAGESVGGGGGGDVTSLMTAGANAMQDKATSSHGSNDSLSTKDSKRRGKESSRKSDSLASKLRSKITKKTDGVIKKSERDTATKKVEDDKKVAKDSKKSDKDKKLDKVDKKVEKDKKIEKERVLKKDKKSTAADTVTDKKKSAAAVSGAKTSSAAEDKATKGARKGDKKSSDKSVKSRLLNLKSGGGDSASKQKKGAKSETSSSADASAESVADAVDIVVDVESKTSDNVSDDASDSSGAGGSEGSADVVTGPVDDATNNDTSNVSPTNDTPETDAKKVDCDTSMVEPIESDTFAPSSDTPDSDSLNSDTPKSDIANGDTPNGETTKVDPNDSDTPGSDIANSDLPTDDSDPKGDDTPESGVANSDTPKNNDDCDTKRNKTDNTTSPLEIQTETDTSTNPTEPSSQDNGKESAASDDLSVDDLAEGHTDSCKGQSEVAAHDGGMVPTPPPLPPTPPPLPPVITIEGCDNTVASSDKTNGNKTDINHNQNSAKPEVGDNKATNSTSASGLSKDNGMEAKVKVVTHRAGGQGDQGDVEFSMADFGSMSQQAEERLAARRAVREEARLIRMKELEKQQRDMEEKQDRIYELTRDTGPVMVAMPLKARSFSSSRRGSDDSTTSSEDTRELKKQLAELEDRYKKAMMNNAQLDNEKQKFRYEVDILKDKYEEIEENHIEIQREHKERCKELEQKKRDLNDIQIEVEYLKLQITQRDKLIQEYGLVFVSNETVEEENDKKKKNRRRRKKEEQESDTAALVTPDALTVLGKVQGNLDERLKVFAASQQRADEEMRRLRVELDEERAKNVLSEKYSPKSSHHSSLNGPSSSDGGVTYEANMEAQKQLTDYRYKLKKAEQDITALEGNVIRLESQVKRYKGSADEGEKTVEDMKLDKRKLQRDLRDAQYKVEELNSQNQNLQTRIKTLKQERIDSIISGKS